MHIAIIIYILDGGFEFKKIMIYVYLGYVLYWSILFYFQILYNAIPSLIGLMYDVVKKNIMRV